MYIYIATNAVNGKQYVGKSINNPYKERIPKHKHARGENPAFHNAIQKYGFDNFTWDVVRYPNASQEALNAIECWHIAKLNTFRPVGYNLTKGGDGVDPEICKETQKKRLADGTHHFLGDKNPSRTPEGKERHSQNARQRVADGTHPFSGKQGSHLATEKNLRRVTEGKNPFAGEQGSQLQKKRIKDGTHSLLGDNNPNRTPEGRERVKQLNLQRISDGTHPFAGENNLSRRRVKNNTHNFLGKNNPMHDPKARLKRWKTIQAKKRQTTIDFD